MMSNAVEEDQLRPMPKDQALSTVPRYAYYALAILTLVNFLNYIDRQVLPTVADLMSRDLGLTDTEIGAMEAALLLSFTILAPVFGLLGDRKSRTRLMASAAIIWSVATGITAFADRLPFLPPSLRLTIPVVGATLTLSGVALVLCLVRCMVGVGESSYSTITPSLIADFFPPLRRATALGIFQAAIPMGFALGYVIGALLAKWFGWRMAFLIVGLPGLVTASFVWRLKEPVRGSQDLDEHLDQSSSAEPDAGANRRFKADNSWISNVIAILTTRDWLLSTAGYTALTFALGAFSTWAILLFVREKGMSATSAGIALGVITLFGGAIGTFGGGWIADRVARKYRGAYFVVCAASSLLSVFPLMIALGATDAYLFLPAVFVTVMILFTNNAPFHAILISSVPSSVRATSVALNIVVIHLFGDAISRFGVGVLSDSAREGHAGLLAAAAGLLGLDPVTHHLTTALLITPVALLVSFVFFAVGIRKSAHSHEPVQSR
jgi:MFS family permease